MSLTPAFANITNITNGVEQQKSSAPLRGLSRRTAGKLMPICKPMRHQDGIVLLIALVVLVAMTLAGIAMIRQITSGVGISGNIGFRQNALTASDLGIESARAVLNTLSLVTPTTLESDNLPGYYASLPATPIDFTLPATWANATTLPIDSTGNTVSYIVHRMCSLPGARTLPNNQCVLQASKAGFTSPQDYIKNGQAFYRITARVQGVRGSTTYVQVMEY